MIKMDFAFAKIKNIFSLQVAYLKTNKDKPFNVKRFS